MKRIYLDYAATTPVDARVFRAMRPYFSAKFGNPGSPHAEGRESFAAVRRARGILAEFFGVASDGVVFTASATEANNLAIGGVVRKWKIENRKSVAPPHIVASAVEHNSVLEVCRALEREGLAEVTYAGVSREGTVDPDDIRKALRPETVLVSVMYANNEVGTIQPIAEIAEVIRKWKIENRNAYPVFHTDAVQVVQFLDCDARTLGVDMLTISSHKIYGPKGAAALISNIYSLISPMIVGGGQEWGLRSGTENVPAIVGFGKALELVSKYGKKDAERIRALQDRFIRHILSFDPKIHLNGSAEFRLPNNAHLSFPGAPSDVLLTMLDRAGISASAGSACDAHAAKPSHVLAAMGVPQELRTSAIRFTFGRFTKSSNIDRAAAIIRTVYSKLKRRYHWEAE